jgi:dTMP kinase
MTFIVLEGPDGAGKSRLQRSLADGLRTRGRDPLELREPGSTPCGEHLRKLLLDPAVGELDALTEAFLFSAARTEMVRTTIRPALEQGRIVLLDRWYWSTIAYQGGGGRAPFAVLEKISEAATGGLEADLVLLLDVPPSVAANRRPAARDRMERRDAQYRERVRAAYAALAKKHADRTRVIDASRPFPAVLAEASGHVERLLAGVPK